MYQTIHKKRVLGAGNLQKLFTWTGAACTVHAEMNRYTRVAMTFGYSIYEVEYLDGHCAALAANIIAENMFAKVDDEGHRTLLLEDVVYHLVNGREVRKDDAFIISPNGGRSMEALRKCFVGEGNATRNLAEAEKLH